MFGVIESVYDSTIKDYFNGPLGREEMGSVYRLAR